ncbi:hypothetical protein J6590_075322 [Homalodisca vitripennis]|nr:hypothetical protein J6590_075322 [Homalodisca vitripennis]
MTYLHPLPAISVQASYLSECPKFLAAHSIIISVQASFFSTSHELSNKQRFEYFTRTIPSDHHHFKAMVEIVRRLGWSYVSIFNEQSKYGIKSEFATPGVRSQLLRDNTFLRLASIQHSSKYENELQEKYYYEWGGNFTPNRLHGKLPEL